MGVSWLGVVLRLILLLVVVPTMIVVWVATSILSGFLGGGRGGRGGGMYGFGGPSLFESWLDPTRHLTGTIPGLGGSPMGGLFDMLMRTLDSTRRPW